MAAIDLDSLTIPAGIDVDTLEVPPDVAPASPPQPSSPPPRSVRDQLLSFPTATERAAMPRSLTGRALDAVTGSPQDAAGHPRGPTPAERREQWQTMFRDKIPMVLGAQYPPATSPAAGTGMLMKAWQALKYKLPRAAYMAGTQAGGTAVGNQFVPDMQRASPEIDAFITTLSDLAGGLIAQGGARAWQSFWNSLKSTADGQMMDQFLRQYGSALPLEHAAGNQLAGTAARVARRFPLMTPMQRQYDEAQQALTVATKDMRAPGRYGGGRVAQAVDDYVDDALRAAGTPQRGQAAGLAQKLAGDVQAIAGPVEPAAVAQRVQERLRSALHEQRVDTRTALQALDAHVLSAAQSTAPLKSRLSTLTIPPGTERDSFFHQVADQLDALRQLPETITIDGALELQKGLLQTIKQIETHLADEVGTGIPTLQTALRDRALPALGNALDGINKILDTKLVPLAGAKRIAGQVLADHEAGLNIPQNVIEGGSGRLATVGEDPHVLAARELLEKPSHVTPFEAHMIASNLGDIMRREGPNVGNYPAEAAERMRRALTGWMEDAAGNPIPGRLYNERSAAGGRGVAGALQKTLEHISPEAPELYQKAQLAYKNMAGTFNSQYVTDLMEAGLDTLTTGLVKNARPNDLKLLHTLVGEDTFRQVGNNWLAQAAQAATDPLTQRLSPTKMLQAVHDLTPAVREELFGNRLDAFVQELRRSSALESAIRTSDYTVLRRDLGVATPGDARLIGEEWLTQQIQAAEHRATGEIDPGKVLDRMKALPDDLEAIMFPGGKLNSVRTALQKADSLHVVELELGKGKSANPVTIQAARSVINDPRVWQHVEADWIAKGLQVENGLLDGAAFRGYLENSLLPEARRQLLQHPEALTALQHLAATAEVIKSGRNKFFDHQAVYWGEHALLGGLTLHLGGFSGLAAATGIYTATAPVLARFLADPENVRWLTAGMRMDANSPAWRNIAQQLIARFGAIERQLETESSTPSTP